MMIPFRAGKGRVVHFPLSVKAAPGAKTFTLSGPEIVEVDDRHRFVRRSRRNGDLERPTDAEVKEWKARQKKAKAEATAAAEKAARDAKAEAKAAADKASTAEKGQ